MAFNWNKFPWTNLHDLNLDWIIQTVKTLENNLADAIGRFTEIANSLISPEREARIAGDAALQSAANTERTERLAGDAALQTEIENGVYPTISRNINDVNTSINTERTERIAGDADLQSTIDDVIMPLINAILKRAPRVYYFSTTAEAGTLTAPEVDAIKTALINHTPVIFIAPSGASQYYYYCVDCTPKPNAENINSEPFAITFRTLDGIYRAGLTFSGSGGSGTVIFDTIS